MIRADLPTYESDPAELRRVFSYFPSGVVALLAQLDHGPVGMVASSFTVGVSTDPPLVSCAIQQSSTTWPMLRTAPEIGISVLAADQGALCRQIAAPDRAARFVGVELRQTGSRAVFIAGAPVWFECTLAGEFPAGDHVIALLRVRALGADPQLSPLVFHASSFHQLMVPAGSRPPVPSAPLA